MAEYIVMPKLGFDMREGELNRWLKEVGETVTRGEVVAEIESDKATLDLESQVDGTLLHVIEEAGAIVPIGANMAIVGEEGEDISAMVEDASSSDGAAAEEAAPAEAAEESAPAKEAKPAVVSSEFPGGVKATPVARRIAEEHEVDLTQVNGSGPDGRIRKADVEEFMAQPKAQPQPAAARPQPTYEIPEDGDFEEVETTKLRQAIGRRMAESKVTVPHFYVTTEIDMAPALALRKQINAALPDDQKVTVNDLIVKGAALTLREFPNLNASFAGDRILRHNQINVGTAVAVEGGLLTIVQRNTDTSTLSKVAVDNKAAIGRAREGKVKPDDVQGSTFTVSNLGAFDVDHFIAIINPPDAAILAIGSAKQVPVVVDGELAIGMRMKVTISADHRVTDGAEAARYLQHFKGIMENPMRLLL